MAQSSLTPRIQRLALFNVCLGQFMSAIDSRSVIVALRQEIDRLNKKV